MASPTAAAWRSAVSNESRTALVTELYNELMRREQDREDAANRVRVWVVAANAELTLWRTSPDKESYAAGVRLKVAQWSAELDAYASQPWPVAPMDRLQFSQPLHDRMSAHTITPTAALDTNSSPPLTQLEQTHVARHLALLDAQNLEIVALYQRHFNEIQRLVTSQVVNQSSSEQREFQKQELQREQEGARLQLQQLHELQQRKLLAHPTNSLGRYLVRSPSVHALGSMLTMMAQRGISAPLVPTAGVATQHDVDVSSLDELVLSPLTINSVGEPDVEPEDHSTTWLMSSANVNGMNDETLATMVLLPSTNGLDSLEPLPISIDSVFSANTQSIPGGHTGLSWTPDNPADASVSTPVVVDLTSSATDEGRRTTANEALRLYYTARVGELRLAYQSDLVALYRELRQMRKAADGGSDNVRKVEALMVDIKKILVVLTRSTRDESVVDEHVEELDRVELYIQRRVHPMSQRLKVKQAIFGDQSRVPLAAARTAQRQWQRFLRRMRDQQQQSPTALPVNVSPPRPLDE